MSDIAVAPTGIERFLKRATTTAKRKLTQAERDEMNARHAQVLANARRTRLLAEQAQAKLDAQKSTD